MPSSSRVILVLLALLLVPATAAHAQEDDRVEILRDCADDDILQGDYPASKMRDALNNMPAELEEYSKCRDILSRGIAAKTAASKPDDGSAAAGPSGGSAGGGNASPAAPDATATASAAPQRTGRDVGVQVGPSTPQDWKAIDGAIERGGDAVPVNGRPVSPAATVGRNGMPGSVIVVLALLGAAALAAFAAPVRLRRLSART
ncbi:hypothetical protein C8N24_4000 [Solirubrobacter pauli]|uniref:Uncharacterized protein n=1 Tax=Solirubrobacter pauli TaxID=166793 RepID=A0A660KZ85_9ACTN|nr:hypothetical protein [Solirubrobacter pauli]RKQ85992.1 hypothetical protein C8N24_4000 [Solirubrobacter pauli]